MRFKRLLRKSYTANVGWYIWRHLRQSIRVRHHDRPASGGAYGGRSPEEAARRALKWGTEFRRRLPAEELERLDLVVEAGVGDSLAMCLLWIGFGANRVWGLDAFGDPRRPRHEKRVFEALLTMLPAGEVRRIREVVDLSGESPKVDAERLRYVENIPTERISEAIPAGSVDFLYSLALLEHVRDLEGSLRGLYGALRPGGRMVHQVDLRNHGVLDEFGEQAFLRPSRFVWKLMGGDSGRPNRKPLSSYRGILRDCGAEFTIESEPKFEVERPSPTDGVPVREARVFWLHAVRPSGVAARQDESEPISLSGTRR